MLRRWTIAAGAVVSIVGAATLRAQNESVRGRQPEDSALVSTVGTADGTIVDKIAFTGLRRISPEGLKTQIVSRAGDELNAAKIEHDVRVLARTGRFATVRVEVQEESPTDPSEDSTQRLQLTFYVAELPFLVKVEYCGSRLLSRAQIEKLLVERKLTPKLGEPENPVKLNQTRRAIETALAELGHSHGHIQMMREESARATVHVRFEISDGPHVPVGRITFEGNPAIPEKLLKRQMQRVSPNAFMANVRGKDAYTPGTFEADRERLLAYYQNHGYPEARVGVARVYEYEDVSRHWLPRPRKIRNPRLAVAIPIEAGAFYRVGSVTTSAALEQAAGIDRAGQSVLGNIARPQVYSAKSVEDLRRAWESRVRTQAKRVNAEMIRDVEVNRAMDAPAHMVRIRLDLSSEATYTVRRLEFRGIHRFPDRYFRTRIGVREGAPLDERALEAGLRRLARTGYFKPIKKEDVHIEPDDFARSVDIMIRVGELGPQRVSLVGGRGQFGSTLGIAYSLFNMLNREELLTSKIEGGPEALELALGFAKEGFLGSRGSLALSAFNTFLRPRLTGSVKGPFFRQRSEGMNADYSYALTIHDVLTASYGLSYSDTNYSPTASSGLTGLVAGNVNARSSSRSFGLGWTRNTGNQQMVLADSVSGGWLGGRENLVRSKAQYGRIVRDGIFKSQNAWAFRTTFIGVGSYSGDMPPTARWYSGDEFVRGLRDGELGPQGVVSSTSPGAARYSTTAAGANLIGASNAEYRIRFGGKTEAAGFFDVGSGLLQRNWLGHWKPATIDATNGIVHGSTGIELRWTLPEVGVPVRAYYAWNVLRLNRSVWMPDGSLRHLGNRLGAFGWGLGSLF
jgi:outer membrane protein assembly complex protein YaeT